MSVTDGTTRDQLLDALLSQRYEPIAVIGAGLRFPGDSRDLDSYAALLRTGGSGIGPIPPDRWDVDALYSADSSQPGRIRTRAGGFVPGIDRFDPRFFNISPKEADYVDPQQRLVLECAWEALESANTDPSALRGGNGGVYVGVGTTDYTIAVGDLANEQLDGYIGTGTTHSVISGRLSYFLGWQGPSISIDTACSSSLTAIHLAVLGLRRRECDLALCGGVNVISQPRGHIVLSRAGMLSPDGQCKTFDDSADGYGRSEGCGMLVLKRMSDAVRDGDDILALVRGSAVRHDGASGGLTVPNGAAQENVMRQALADAMVAPGEVQYVEAHGTGTSLGDPIEMSAIHTVLGTAPDRTDPVVVGSVKTNIGHMESAAAVGGVLKVVLQMRDRTIYRHLNLETPSRHIPWDRYHVTVPTEPRPWTGGPLRALVNSFGFSGSIGSLVIEEPPPVATAAETPESDREAAAATAVFTLSARSRNSLEQQVERYQRHLAENPGLDLADLCHTTNVGRAHLALRLSGPVRTHEDLAALLRTAAARGDRDDAPRHQRTAFLFSGQGSQYAGMGSGLYRHYPVFRRWLDECDRLFRPHLGRSIREIVLGGSADGADEINRTSWTQPALFSLEYALARLWLSWGAEPEVMIGHSIGEVTAAAVAGLFDLPDAIRLVAARAAAMQSVATPGRMIGVSAPAEEVADLLSGYPDVALAALNAPRQCVVSGGTDAVTAIERTLLQRGVKVRGLAVSHAFHSPLMADAAATFGRAIAGIRFHEPALTLVSNLTGDVAGPGEMATPEYWVRQVREPVRFLAGMRTIGDRGRHAFIEIGPSGTLTALGRQCLDRPGDLWLTSLHPERADQDTIRAALSRVYDSGLPVSWTAYHTGRRLCRVPLPVYPFDRRRYWLPVPDRTRRAAGEPGPGHPLLGAEISTPEQRSGGVREFAARLSADRPGYLADHVVMDQVVFPGAGYLEVFLALQDAVHGETSRPVEDVRIHEPLLLAAGETTELRTRLDSTGAAIVSIVAGTNGPIERRHATAALGPAGARTEEPDGSPDGAGETVPVDELYAELADRGLAYGPEFRRLRGLSRNRAGLVVAEVAGLPGPIAEHLPPPVLDAALQAVAALAGTDSGDTFLPVRFGRFQLFKKPRGDLRAVVRRAGTGPDGVDLAADVLLFEGDRPVAALHGLGLRRVARPAGAVRQLFHQPRWVKRALPQPAGEPARARHALVVGRTREDLGAAVETVPDGAGLTFAADPGQAGRLLRDRPDVTDLWWFWTGRPGLRDECERNYRDVLALIAAADAAGAPSPARIWLVTEGGQWLRDDDPGARTAEGLAASTLWGFGAVLLNEYPRHRVTMVDLPPAGDGAADYRPIVREWLAADPAGSEFQIAYRDSGRHVRRIHPVSPGGPDGDYELAVATYGELSGIRPSPLTAVPPRHDEIQVRVHTAGLNFRDVLNALGLLRRHAEDTGVTYRPLPLGFEGAGTVVAAGPDAGFEAGDQVLFNHLGCLRSTVTLPSASAVRKPPEIGWEQAAALPVAYVTAYHALHDLAALRAGDRVLIHAAAGGVGQAAVQLALRAGARVYATASPHKWPMLRAQGVEYVTNSRSLGFAADIRAATGGEGVDLVLNSLSGEYVSAGLRCLAAGGRFVELGKIGIHSPEQVHEERPDVEYHVFDLSELPEDQHRRLARRAMREAVDAVARGELAPIPVTAYTTDELEEAFNVLSRGANVGKLVVRLVDDEAPAAAPLDPVAGETYLITGGLGALGLAVARELADRGARHLALVSRRTVGAEELRSVRDRLAGAEVTVHRADVADEADVARLMAELDGTPYPLGGVIHAAGVLDDAPVAQQTWERIETVMRPKVYGARLLHRHTEHRSGLRFFITCSSLAAVLGPVAQANYAAANTYLDVLMQWRAARGLPGLSVNWGPLAGSGMAAGMDDQHTQRVQRQGVRFLRPAVATRALVQAAGQPWAQVMAAEFDWPRLAASLPLGNALFRQVAAPAGTAATVVDVAELRALPPAEREAVISDLVRSRIAELLRFDGADEVEPDVKLTDLGLDSLVAVELRNSLEAALRMAVPASLTFDHPSVAQLSRFLAQSLEPEAERAEPVADDTAGVRELSEAEAEAELAAWRGIG
ncbi:type I polyketide synthase [Actinoplanes sp. NPDC049802]|uniref:type I polyketide synthase n=1 Tax=Actinoplanes sp. NPDC049802 TaxID=3154742 RepID=UPI0033DE0DD8